MRWDRKAAVGLASLAASGCFFQQPMYVGRSRPAIAPAPVDVQEEIRDARYFLPLPDESLKPSSGFEPSWLP